MFRANSGLTFFFKKPFNQNIGLHLILSCKKMYFAEYAYAIEKNLQT